MPQWLALTICVLGPLLIASNASLAFANEPPANAPKPAPMPNFAATLAQTAAVIEGVVASVENEHAVETGPWTRIYFEDIVVHRGALRAGKQPTEMSFVQFGGEHPDGRITTTSLTSDFTIGERYVLFLRNTSWNFIPYSVVPLRVSSSDGSSFLATVDGRPLVSVSTKGFRFSSTPLFTDLDRGLAPAYRRSGYQRNSEKEPSSVVGVDKLLEQVDWHTAFSAFGGVRIGGPFYDEPTSRSARRRVRRHPSLPGNFPSDAEPKEVQTQGREKVEAHRSDNKEEQ